MDFPDAQQHLHADEDEHEGQADLQVAEEADRPRQHEVERAQAQDGEDVRGEDDEGVLRDGEDGGDGVHGEDEVGGLHHQQHERERREGGASVVELRHEVLAVEFMRHGEESLCELDDEVLLGVHALVVHEKHLDAGEDEEAAHHVEHPVELFDERRAEADHHAAHDQCAKDAPEQDPVLLLQGHAEIGEDERDDEDVVHREAQLDDVAGDELDGFARRTVQVDEAGEGHRQREPQGGPTERLAELHDVRRAVEDAEVQREEHHDGTDEGGVVPRGDFDDAKHLGGGFRVR